MKLALAGLNHRTAPVEVRERFAFRMEQVAEALQLLQQHPNTREGMILSTCNRVEVAITIDEEASAEAFIAEFLAKVHGVAPETLRPFLYYFEDESAIRHLFRVASSLDSMIVGEPQILGQLKQAYSQAKEQGTIGSYLSAVVPRAFSVAKRVRSETEIGQSAVSVSYAAVELAKEIFGSLAHKRVMLVGAGKMSEAAARNLLRSGVTEILVTNRTKSRANEMASLFSGHVIPYEQFPAHLPGVDILIASSAAPEYVLTKEIVKRALDVRRNRPMFLIDIAVPRNIDPHVNELEHAFLYDIDDLQKIVDRNLQSRVEVAETAEQIITEEVQKLEARLRARDLAPTITRLQEQLELMRVGEMTRFRGRLGSLTKEQEEAIEALTRAIINKVAHGPISELRRQAAERTEDEARHSELVSAVQRFFRLKEQ